MRKRISAAVLLLSIPLFLFAREPSGLVDFYYSSINQDFTGPETEFINNSGWPLVFEEINFEVTNTGSKYDLEMVVLDESRRDSFSQILSRANEAEMELLGGILVKLYNLNMIVKTTAPEFLRDKAALEEARPELQGLFEETLWEHTQFLLKAANMDYFTMNSRELELHRIESEKYENKMKQAEAAYYESRDLPAVLDERFKDINTKTRDMDHLLDNYISEYARKAGDDIRGMITICDIVFGEKEEEDITRYSAGTLKLVSNPEGAVLKLGGTVLGTSPLNLDWILPGTYELSAGTPNYQSETHVFSAREKRRIDITLTPLVKLSLDLGLPEGTAAEISGDEGSVSLKSGEKIEIPEGNYKAAFSGDLIIPETKDYAWEGPAEISIGGDLSLRTGTLSLKISPHTGTVKIDGREQAGGGADQYELTVGTHQLEFDSDVYGYFGVTEPIQIKENRETVFKAELVGSAELKITEGLDFDGTYYLVSNREYGTFELYSSEAVLPTGRWKVRAWSEQGYASSRVNLEPGDDKEIEFNTSRRTAFTGLVGMDLRLGSFGDDNIELPMFNIGGRYDIYFGNRTGLFLKSMTSFKKLENSSYSGDYLYSGGTLVEERASLGYHMEFGYPEIGACLGAGPAVDYLYYQIESPYSDDDTPAGQLTGGFELYAGVWLSYLYCDFGYYHFPESLRYPAMEEGDSFINPSGIFLSLGARINLGKEPEKEYPSINELDWEAVK